MAIGQNFPIGQNAHVDPAPDFVCQRGFSLFSRNFSINYLIFSNIIGLAQTLNQRMAGKIAKVFPKSSFYAPIVNLIVRSMIIPNWSNLRASELVWLIRQYYRLVKIMRIILPRAKLNVLRFVFLTLRLVPVRWKSA